MDRVPYRRVTTRRDSGPSQSDPTGYDDRDESEPITHGETLIMQCIISGIIMVFVLVAAMTNIAPAVALRGGISQVLSGAETLDELITDVRRFGAEWFGWEEVAPREPALEFTIPSHDFNNSIEAESTVHDFDGNPGSQGDLYDSYSSHDSYSDTSNPMQGHHDYSDYDNSGIYSNEPPTAGEESNPTVPEPTVTPGL